MFLWIILFSVLCLLAVLHFILKEFAQIRKVENIPGLKPVPIFGNLFDIILSPSDFFKLGRTLAKKYKRFYRLWILQDSFINLLKPEDIEAILSNIKHIKKSRIYDQISPWLREGLLTSYGTKWQTRRKILTPAFHFNILQQFVNVFEEHSKGLVAQLELECEKDSTDINLLMADVALHNICETALGTNLKSLENTDSLNYKQSIYSWGKLFIYRLQRYWLHPDIIFGMTPTGCQMKKVILDLHSFTKGVISDRKKRISNRCTIADLHCDMKDEFEIKKRMAMLDLLLSAEARGENIDEDGIHEEVDTFTFEGHDTTSMGLIFTLMSLANNPLIQKRAYEEVEEVLGKEDQPASIHDLQKLTYLDRCIKESLRLYPSVPFISRYLTDPLELGQKFAMLELKSVISAILRHYTMEPITRPQDVVFMCDIVLRTDHPIKIKFKRRQLN